MKITIEHYDEKISIETKSDDLTTNEVLDKIRGLLVACGYSEQNIIDSFYDLYEEHKFKLPGNNKLNKIINSTSGYSNQLESIEPQIERLKRYIK